MNTRSYPAAVSRLLSYGVLFEKRAWPDYVAELGLRDEHIGALIQMATDPELLEAEEGTPEASAPIHAWRALGQLGAVAAVDPLLSLFASDHAWVYFDMPTVLGKIGAGAIPKLAARLHGSEREPDLEYGAIASLIEIAKNDSSTHDAIVSVLKASLEKYRDHDIATNAYLAKALCALRAKDAMPIIEDVYLHQRADLNIFNWDQVLEAMKS